MFGGAQWIPHVVQAVKGADQVVLLAWKVLGQGDFEAAIEEGATMVRVGSSLFEGVDR